jgi:hypothetical protein
MKVLLLPDTQFEYLQHVVRCHSASGIEPEEGLAIYQLWQSLGQAQTVDVSQLGKVRLDKIGPEGVSLVMAPETPATEDQQS